ncbi:Centromere protein H [Heterocephalus glaber]|uniref:Centromere protein H n=1 Tax=Heterocephalus glaber TaxID=10181 RepID=G5B8V0_HETGA|nr:Centromere protein H [Heterocephalus glaber]
MEQQAEDPLGVASSDPGGAGGPPEVTGSQKARSEEHMALLFRLRAQTKQQLLEYKSMIDANEEKPSEQIIQEKQIEAKVEDLQNEIEEVKIALEMKSLALSRMQLSAALKNDLEKINTGNSVLMDTMKEVLKLNKSVMKQESWELEEKLLDVRKKRFQLKQASESKLLEIETEKKKRKEELGSMENSDKIKTMKQSLQRERQIATVIQHVFQNLILGSKVNWAADPALKETVLELEKDLTMI